MSKVTRVAVLCPNGKRQIVNLTPNSSILQILEEVCQKQNLNPGDFDICHYNKPMDLTLPVRFANLSNNAQLELQPVKVARKECLVTIGLQLESGERIMKDFVPSTSVWDVVEQCLNASPDKKNEKGEPICIYMRQKLVGESLKETTLHGLGLTKGSAVIRLLYRNPDDLSDQAHSSAPLSKPVREKMPTPSTSSTDVHGMKCDKSENMNVENTNVTPVNSAKLDPAKISEVVPEEKELSKDCSMSTNEERITKNNRKSEASPMDLNSRNEPNILNKPNEVSSISPAQNNKLDSTTMDVESLSEIEDIGAIHYIGSRHAVIYSLDDITDVKKADLPDEFFQLTIDDAKYLMEQFKKTRMDLENRPLLTKELRNRQLLQKLGRFKQTVIRVYFPERLVLQAVFGAQETIQDVCDFIRNFLNDKSLNFYLYTAPPKEKKDPAKTLIESMLIPAAVMYFGCEKHNSFYLLEELKEKVSDPRAASLAASESRKETEDENEDITHNQTECVKTDGVKTDLTEDVESYKVPVTSFSQASSSGQSSGKVPKWFKMSKK